MPTQYDGLERFLRRVEQARRSQAKELRLTTDEAADLTLGIGLLLTRVTVAEAEARAAAPVVATGRIDGGGLG